MIIGQLMFDGLVMGLVFVLLATGLVLIASVNKILFMAYGVFYTIGAYSTWYIVHYFHFPYFISMAIGALCSGCLGMLSYVLIFRRFQNKEGAFLATLIASLGLDRILSQGGLLIYGTVPRSLPAIFKGTTEIFGITMTNDKLLLIAIGVGVTLVLFWIYEKTSFGRAMRAVAFLPKAAVMQGINVNMLSFFVLGLGTALAGIAGGILAPTYGISPNMGSNILWTVLLMTMLGGMDSLIGAVAGGIVIGQFLSFGQFYIGGTIQIIVFLFIGVVLYFRPAGLLGRGIKIEV